MNADETREEFKRLDDRITMQNETMKAMWKRWEVMFERDKWLQEAYPEIVAQYKAIEDLKRASRVGVGGLARPEVKGEGDEVRYGNT